MTAFCDYCRGACEAGAVKCKNCGAPLEEGSADFRFCPYCRKRLLALGSPACNYCGRRLPGSYVEAHLAARRRIDELEGARAESDENDQSMVGVIARLSGRKHADPSTRDLIDGLLSLTDF